MLFAYLLFYLDIDKLEGYHANPTINLMFCTNSGTAGGVGPVKQGKASPPVNHYCCLFLVSEFRRRFTLCLLILFSSVKVAEWPSFGKELLTRLIIFSRFILMFDYLLF